MADKAPKIPNQFCWEEEVERISWYKNDLRKGGWQTILRVPGESAYYIKKFTDDPIPITVLYEWDLPLPGNVVFEAYVNLNKRKKWDTTFEIEVLEPKTDEEGQIFHVPFSPLPWPFARREWVFCLGSKELPEKKAWLVNLRDVTHPSKPVRSDMVRMHNGGNFYYINADENHPDEACKLFGLTSNDIGGWIPGWLKWSTKLWNRKIPGEFEKLRKDLVREFAVNQSVK